jgi:HAD superfamily hydrolase (TIGR01662 family)
MSKQKTQRHSWLEHHNGVVDIDFELWHKQYGITTVIFDVDGTLAPWLDPHVDPGVLKALKKARASGIQHFGIASNMSRRNSERLEAIAKRIGAETFHLPRSLRERKPSSFMIRTALRNLHIDPEHSAFVGDKIVDVISGRRAGVARVVWVSRLGKGDHFSDRWLYRPIEFLLKRFTK